MTVEYVVKTKKSQVKKKAGLSALLGLYKAGDRTSVIPFNTVF